MFSGRHKLISPLRMLGRQSDIFYDVQILSSKRRALAAVGVLGLLVLGLLRPGILANDLAQVVFLLLVVATLVLAWESRTNRMPGNQTVSSLSSPPARVNKKRQALIAALISATLPAVAIQTWFQPNTSLARGDLTVPSGTAWLTHLFSSWFWSGSNLGGPAALQLFVPWATILKTVHVLGGSAALAQRLWLTILVSGASLATYAVLRGLGLSALPSVLGALCYVFNAYFVSTVGFSALYLAAIMLFPGLLATVIWVANGKLSILTGCILLVCAAPLLGYTAMNPPLAGASLIGLVAGVPMAALLGGRDMFRRSLRFIVFGLPVLLLASAYWIVPLYIQVSVADVGSLSSLSSWVWAEGRETLRNGFWLNDSWGWKYPQYFPFAPRYSEFPLNVLRFLLPATAFSALLWPSNEVGKQGRVRNLRITAVISACALFGVLLSTGTNEPGSPIFRILYSLPFGWLLQGPGRFLYVVGFCYAILVATVAEIFLPRLSEVLAREQRLGLLESLTKRVAAPVRLYSLLAFGFLLVVAPAYPIFTGALTPNQFPGSRAGVHVRLPSYWTSMVTFLNYKDTPGNLLVLPQDNFYQVNYTWGYYGSDGFITDMISRNVLDVVPTTYFNVSGELINSVQLFTKSLLSHDWLLASELAQALGTSQVLVREDVSRYSTANPSVPVSSLTQQLQSDPLARQIYASGPLHLYLLSKTSLPKTPGIYTVNSSVPMLQILQLLPAGSVMVTGPPLPNTPALIQLPSAGSWSIVKGALTEEINIPDNGTISASVIGRVNAIPFSSLQTHGVTRIGPYSVSMNGSGQGRKLDVSEPTGQVLQNGAFQNGFWNTSVGDCNDRAGAAAHKLLTQALLPKQGPGGTTALLLKAGVDSACESKTLQWKNGPLVLSMWVRHLSGSPPRICLWESNLGRCLQIPPVPTNSSWVHYQVVANPDPTTSSLALFLYADGPASGNATVNEYADVSVQSLPTVSRLVFLLNPAQTIQSHPLRLVTRDSTWSSDWNTKSDANHVLVDGMRNGWLLRGSFATSSFSTYYAPRSQLLLAYLISLVIALVAIVATLFIVVRGVVRLAGDKSHHPSP